MDVILVETVRRCLAEMAESTSLLGVDSSSIETTRYETVERSSIKERNVVEARQKIYWKYQITAVLCGLLSYGGSRFLCKRGCYSKLACFNPRIFVQNGQMAPY